MQSPLRDTGVTCYEMVNPILEIGMLQCLTCDGGFLEEMATATSLESDNLLVGFLGE